MKKLNMFQKDLLILASLFAVHMVFTLAFPLTSAGVFSEAEVPSRWFVMHFENLSTGESYTYYPVLFALYILFLAYLVLKKDKSLTLIYGFGLVLLAKFNFLSQLTDLQGLQENLHVEGVLMKSVYVDGQPVAQDVSAYVLLILILIKAAIVIYQSVTKRIQTKPFRKKNEATQ